MEALKSAVGDRLLSLLALEFLIAVRTNVSFRNSMVHSDAAFIGAVFGTSSSANNRFLAEGALLLPRRWQGCLATGPTGVRAIWLVGGVREDPTAGQAVHGVTVRLVIGASVTETVKTTAFDGAAEPSP